MEVKKKGVVKGFCTTHTCNHEVVVKIVDGELTCPDCGCRISDPCLSGRPLSRPACVSNEIVYLMCRVSCLKRRNKGLRKSYIDNEVKVGLLKCRVEELREDFNGV